MCVCILRIKLRPYITNQDTKKFNKDNFKKGDSKRCFECEGRGHRAFECPTKLKRQGKEKAVYNATLSDSDNESEDSDDSNSPRNNFTAFMASLASNSCESNLNVDNSEHNLEVVSSHSTSSDEKESDSDIDESELQTAYSELYNESLRIQKVNKRLTLEVLTLEKELKGPKEKEALVSQLEAIKISLSEKLIVIGKEKCYLIISLESANKELNESHEIRTSLETKIVQLEKDLESSREVKVTLEDNSGRMGKLFLGPVLGYKEKGYQERKGIGYEEGNSSKVKTEPVAKFVTKSNVPKDNKSNVPKVNPSKKHLKAGPKQSYVCSYCHKQGHLKDFYYKLGKNPQFTNSKQPYSSLSNLKSQVEYLVNTSKNLMEEFLRFSNVKRNNSNYKTRANQGKKTTQTWVKKNQIKKAFVAHVALKAQNTSQWYFDSGCSRHMMGDKSLFTTLENHKDGKVTFGDGSKSQIIGRGY